MVVASLKELTSRVGGVWNAYALSRGLHHGKPVGCPRNNDSHFHWKGKIEVPRAESNLDCKNRHECAERSKHNLARLTGGLVIGSLDLADNDHLGSGVDCWISSFSPISNVRSM